MKSAQEYFKASTENYLKRFETLHVGLLTGLQTKMAIAAAKGEFKVTDVFIEHKIKDRFRIYLESKGYIVREQKLGNTFTISWDLTSKK